MFSWPILSRTFWVFMSLIRLHTLRVKRWTTDVCLVTCQKNINIRNKVRMRNILRAQSVRGWPEDCACVLRLHSHSENLFLVNFPRKGGRKKKNQWMFFWRGGINGRRCTPATSPVDAPGSRHVSLTAKPLIRALKWWVARKFTAVVVGRAAAAEGCHHSDSERLPNSVHRLRVRKCLQVWSLIGEGYFSDVRGVCVLDGAYMCLAPPTPLRRTAVCRGSAAWCSSSSGTQHIETNVMLLFCFKRIFSSFNLVQPVNEQSDIHF